MAKDAHRAEGVSKHSSPAKGEQKREEVLERAEEEVVSLAKFPSETPNPVFRISSDGTILYANQSSQPVLETWGCGKGERIPEPYRQRLKEAFDSGKVCNFEFPCSNGQIFSVTLSPVPQSGYANVYGLDITDRKHAEEELKRQRYYLAKAQEMGKLVPMVWTETPSS